MAIDTAEKRKTVSGIQVTQVVGVTPNATPDQAWREEAGWGYPGLVTAWGPFPVFRPVISS